MTATLLDKTSPCEDSVSVDRRQARRFEVCAPVIFGWTDPDGSRHEGAGFTRNISTVGLFVVTHSSAPSHVGSIINVEVALPAMGDRTRGMQLVSQGPLVRLEKLSDGMGMGIASPFSTVEDSADRSFFQAVAQ